MFLSCLALSCRGRAAGVQTLEDQAGGDGARQGLQSSSDHPTGHSSCKDSNNSLDIIHMSIHHLWTSSLLGRVKDLEDETKVLWLDEPNLCPRSVSKSRRDGLNSAPRALLGSFTWLSFTHQLCPGISLPLCKQQDCPSSLISPK